MLLLIGGGLGCLAILRAHWRHGRSFKKSLPAAEQERAELAHTLRRCLASQVVCGEERPVVSASQRARWRAGGAVRQRNAPLPMVCNCDRSIVANGLYSHMPDPHNARASISARLPCATLRKSSPPRVIFWSQPVETLADRRASDYVPARQ